MFNAVAAALQEVLAKPSEQLFGLLTEIRDNLADIRDGLLTDLDPGEDEKIAKRVGG